jgi:hypothetical protein
MEEVYILSNGSQVDISNFSDFEKINFLSKNPGAKKRKGTAKSAGVVPKKNQALNKNTGSNLANGSSGSQKFRLADDKDFENYQQRGIAPPPSETRKYASKVDTKDLYGPAQNLESDYDKIKYLLNPKAKRSVVSRLAELPDAKIDVNNLYNLKPGSVEHANSAEEVAKVKRKIQETDSELKHPYLYYSKANPEVEQDDFVESNYNAKQLEALGINPQDFDGYLNKKGYKQDYLSKKQQGLFDGVGDDFGTGYEIKLAEELARKKMLTFYMEEMQRRDFTKQDLNQEIEVILGKRKDKEIQKTKLFDQNGLTNYVEKNFPIITQKLKERDVENAKLYKEAKSGGTDFFSWDTASKLGKAGWNAVVDRINQFTATAYDVIGMDETAEGIRLLGEENEFLKPDDRGVAYVSGKKINYNGTKYIVDSRGEIYDADAKIRVTDLFDEKTYQKLIEDSKYEPSDYMFSTQGAAVQTSGVVADMLLQAALTRGVGTFGSIASETRMALVGAQKASKFTPLLNDASQLLRSIPLERGVGYSLIAQSTLGYTQGYEDTLKAARDNGINDEEAIRLATNAGTMMAALYAATGNINPQTKLVENLFSPKRVIKEAMEQYLKVGEKGFVNYLRKTIANVPKNLIEFVEEGGKEVIQENIQQAGEIGVNMITNKDAGKKIVNDVMTGDDFVNTSILSFVSSGLMSKVKMPDFHKRTEAEDDLMSLSTLAKNKKEFDKTVKNLVDNKVFTQEQVDKLKQDVDIYYNNINKLPKTTSAEVAMPIMRELDKVQKLVDEKQSVDKSFHEDIDKKIEEVRSNVKRIVYGDQLRLKNKAAASAIKRGVIKNTQMLTFGSEQEIVDYLRSNMNITLEKARDYANQAGFIMGEGGLRKYSKDPDKIVSGQKIIFVNEGLAIKQGQISVAQHEFLHGLISESVKNDPEAQQLLGKALGEEIVKLHEKAKAKNNGEEVMTTGFSQKMGKYIERYNKMILQTKKLYEDGEISKEEYESKRDSWLGDQWEEVLTVFSDEIARGNVTYDEGTFVRLKDIIRQVLQFIGIKDIEFASGKDVYNFIKDYNKSMETGHFGFGMRNLAKSKTAVNKTALRKELKTIAQKSNVNKNTDDTKFALSNKNKDKKRTPEQIKKDVDAYYDRENFTKKINSQRDTLLDDILAEYDFIIKEKSHKYSGLPNFSYKDFLWEVKIALMPHVRNFNKEFLEKREEYKKQLIDKGEDPNSQKFKDKVLKQDQEGYQGKKGIVKENNSLNGWINAYLKEKIYIALNTGNVADKQFLGNIDDERFKETKMTGDYSVDLSEEFDYFGENDEVFDAEQDFEQEQNKLAVLLRDPIFRFVNEDGSPVEVDIMPRGVLFITDPKDADIPALQKLKTETDPAKREELLKDLKDLERGFELESKEELTEEEKQELQDLKSFKSFYLSSGNMELTYKALSTQDAPARIITEQIGKTILNSPNIETLEYRNFKEKFSTMSMTMMKRMTFERGAPIESLMYNNWDLLYNVINHPVDPVTGQSSYASKKLPPRLKELDDKGNLRKIGDITRVKFLQSFYGIPDATRIIKKYGGDNANAELQQFEKEEVNDKTGKPLTINAYFDRRTALRELFGDVMVLQEARRLLRDDVFLEKVKEKNINLYKQLKDDIARAAILQDMAKGKSEVVKFSLSEAPNPFNDLYNSPFYNQLVATRKELTNGIVGNVLYGYESIDDTTPDVKFSLSDFNEKFVSREDVPRYNVGNKKYLSNFNRLFLSYPEDLGLAIPNPKATYAEESYYAKALQFSDIEDNKPGDVKLHTLKSFQEVETEVVSRIDKMIYLMKIEPKLKSSGVDPNSRLGKIMGLDKVNTDENPFLIKEYVEGYVEKMLQKSIEKQDQMYIEYWTNLRDDPSALDTDIYDKQSIQYEALEEIVKVFYNENENEDFHNGRKISFGLKKPEFTTPLPGVNQYNQLKYNPFFTYLFLKDVLSNRYYLNPITDMVDKKPFKKSEYKTTIEPLNLYKEDVIDRVYKNFHSVDIKNPAFVYSMEYLVTLKDYQKDWSGKRRIKTIGDTGVDLYRFEQSRNEKDAQSLNALASFNRKNTTGQWCTGQGLNTARNQLRDGEFIICSIPATDKQGYYSPIIALRLEENHYNGFGEICGIEPDQEFTTQQIPLVIAAVENCNAVGKETALQALRKLDEFVNGQKLVAFDGNVEDDVKLLRQLKNLLIGDMVKRFQLEGAPNIYEEMKFFVEQKALINDEEMPMRTLEDLITSKSAYSVDINFENEEDFNLIQSLENIEIDDFTSTETEEDIVRVKYDGEGMFDYNLPNLYNISQVYFSEASKFSAPNLITGIDLTVYGEQKEFESFLELPKQVTYGVEVNVVLDRSLESFTLSDNDIDIGGKYSRVVVHFAAKRENKQIETSMDVSTLVNTGKLVLGTLADYIFLPKKINELSFHKPDFDDVKNILFIGAEEVSKLEITDMGMQSIADRTSTVSFIDKINFQVLEGINKEPSIKTTVIKTSIENTTPDLEKRILDSEIGLYSKNITLQIVDFDAPYKQQLKTIQLKTEDSIGDVKFSLSDDVDYLETKKKVREINDKKQFYKTEKSLLDNIGGNIFYGFESIDSDAESVKFSLSELDSMSNTVDNDYSNKENAPVYQPSNKKYLNHFENLLKSYPYTYGLEEFNIAKVNLEKSYYAKALEYSDLSDTKPNDVKIHTLKNYQEIEDEVVMRVHEILGDISETDNKANEYLMQEYKEGYIDRMIEKSIKDQEEDFEKYWKALKDNPELEKQSLVKIRSKQFEALYKLRKLLYNKDYHNGEKNAKPVGNSPKNGLLFNPFFTYLFLKDVLGNRFEYDANTDSVSKKSFKKSEYKTTIEPLDIYDKTVLEKSYVDFHHINLRNPAFVYKVAYRLYLKKDEDITQDWEKNRKVGEIEDASIYKFNKSVDGKDTKSLHMLASLNSKETTGKWCTGQDESYAIDQLKRGDFIIVATPPKTENEFHYPKIAIRLDETRKNGIGEICGIEKSQRFGKDELKYIIDGLDKTDLDDKEKLKQAVLHMYQVLSNPEEDWNDPKFSKINANTVSFIRSLGSTFKIDPTYKLEIFKKINKLTSAFAEYTTHDPTLGTSNIVIPKSKIEMLTSLDVIDASEIGILDEYDLLSFEIKNQENFDYNLPNLTDIRGGAIFKNAESFSAPLLSNIGSNGLDVHLNKKTSSTVLDLPDMTPIEVYLGGKINKGVTKVKITDKPLEIEDGFGFICNIRFEEITGNNIIDASNVTCEGTFNINTTNLDRIHMPRILDHVVFGDVYNPETRSRIQDETEDLLLTNISEITAIDFENTYSIKKALGISFQQKPKNTIDSLKKLISTKPTNPKIGRVAISSFKKEFLELGLTIPQLNQKLLNSEISRFTEEVELSILDEKLDGSVYVWAKSIVKSTVNPDRTGTYNTIDNADSGTKFSLAEEDNAQFSLFLNGLPLSQQWIVARDIDNAITAAKTATFAETEVIEKLNKKITKETDPVKLKDLKEKLEEVKKKGKITFKVPSRSKETDKSTAYLIISKVAEGYNNFEFTVKKNADGPLTKQVLEALDFKSKEVQTRMNKNGNLEQTMNEIIEENEGVEASETFSPETAKNLGKNIGRFDLYLPPEDEDFLGLMYKLASAKGDKGEKQIQFFVDNLLKPYSDAMLNLMKARQTMYKDWKNLINKKHKGITKVLKKDCGYGGYTYDQAVRVYLWENADYTVPGLNKKDIFQLVDIIRTNPELRAFAEDVSLMSKQANGYIEPDSNWGFGSVVGDMNNIISKANRTKFLEHWQSNVDKIFSKDNLAKIEAVYGRRYVIALKNMLERMQTGSNRQKGASDAFLNFLNGSTAITMFWNMRSALLQLLSSINYINTSDNNILKAGKAFLNQKQYWTDVLTVWNSNYTRDRRSGLMNDVAEAELNQLMNDSRNISVLDKVKAVKYWILKNGFGATRIMDSLAISLGGATFYRNRLKTYMKQGYSEEDAKKATWRDLYETSEQSQQSADVSKISMNQSSTKGRLLLTFMNTPFQYSRLMKRAASDLVKGRGSVPNNIAKILYYGAVQNAIFNYLQNAMFAQMFGDDDDEDEERLDQQKIRTLNGILDAVIRGSGMIGVMTSAVKNAILKWYEKSGDPKGYGDVMLELQNMSPVVGIKFRQLAKAYKAFEYNKEEIMEKGFSVTNTYAIEALTSITSMVQNIPADRVYQKFLNVKGAFNSEYETWQRVALLLGWSEWNLGLIEKEPKGNKGLDMNVDLDVDVDVDI